MERGCRTTTSAYSFASQTSSSVREGFHGEERPGGEEVGVGGDESALAGGGVARAEGHVGGHVHAHGVRAVVVVEGGSPAEG